MLGARSKNQEGIALAPLLFEKGCIVSKELKEIRVTLVS